MHWSKRLTQVLEERGWTQVRLAEESGVSAKSIQKYESGLVEQPRGDTIRKLARALHVDPLWLRDGTGDKRLEMPVGFYVGAGEAVHPLGDTIEFVPCPGGDENRHIVAIVRGDSMIPYVQHAEYVMALKDPPMSADRIASLDLPAIVHTTSGQTWLKRLRHNHGNRNHYDLLSFNPAFDPIEDVEIDWCAPVIRRWTTVLGDSSQN